MSRIDTSMKIRSITTVGFLWLAAASIAWADNPFIVFDPFAQEELKLSDDQKHKLLEKLPSYLQKESPDYLRNARLPMPPLTTNCGRS